MANFFLLYLPIEDVDEELPEDSNFELKTKTMPPLKNIEEIKTSSFRPIASSPDFAKLNQNKNKNEEIRAEDQEETENLDPENRPLLQKEKPLQKFPSTDEMELKHLSLNNIDEKKRRSSHSQTEKLLKSVEPVNVEGKGFRDVPNSRFKISEVASQDKMEVKAANPKVEEGGDQDHTENGVLSLESMTLREFLEEKLTNKLKIRNHVWQKTNEETQWMVTFLVPHDQCDAVYNFLMNCGLGWIPGTSISVFPTSVHKEGAVDLEGNINVDKEKSSERSEFMKSIKSSLTVAQVVGDISTNAKLTFDFLLLILLASIIAGFGLAENSSVVLVASMLISPLMGPIIGFTFGLVIRNWNLCKLSARTELIGLSICVIWGFVFGIVVGAIDNSPVRYTSDGVFPTTEMTARGLLRSLWVGIFIALPSGAGVALSILGGNTGSLVGVAISASLLPPLVNAGMLWGLALISSFYKPVVVSNSTAPPTFPLNPPFCPGLKDNDYKFVYSCNMSLEAMALGSVSFLLAILNIICIFIMGTVVMKIKELSPLPGANKKSVDFWKKDIHFYKTAYETVKGAKIADWSAIAKSIAHTVKEKGGGNIDKIIESIKKDSASNLNEDLVLAFSKELREEAKYPDLPLEFIFHDQRYHTVGGNMVPLARQNVENFFNNKGDSNDFRKSSFSPLGQKFPFTQKSPGGCVIRQRRSIHRPRAKSSLHYKISMEPKIDLIHEDKPLDTNNNPRKSSQEEEEEEDDEFLIFDYDHLATHTKRPRFQKRTISMSHDHSYRIPSSPLSFNQLKVKFKDSKA